MKVPFDIELFKKHGSKIEFLEYRNGTKPLDIWLSEVLINDNSRLYPITTALRDSLLCHNLDGSYGGFSPCIYDLFINIPDEVVEFYQNVDSNGLTRLICESLEKADSYAMYSNRLAVNKVTVNKTTGEVKSEILPG